MSKLEEYNKIVDSDRQNGEKKFISENRNELKCCPYCNGNIQDRIITFYRELIEDLHRVYEWCNTTNRHEFKMGDIKHLLCKNSYARFGDLVHFGGLVYKKEKAQYGLNTSRCKEFFENQRQAPMQIKRNQITNETIEANYVYAKDIIGIGDLMVDGKYDEKMVFPMHYKDKK